VCKAAMVYRRSAPRLQRRWAATNGPYRIRISFHVVEQLVDKDNAGIARKALRASLQRGPGAIETPEIYLRTSDVEEREGVLAAGRNPSPLCRSLSVEPPQRSI